MKSFRTLLKLAARDLETLRRALADLIARQVAVEDRIAGHEQTILAEQQAAQRDYESQAAYGGYAVAAIQVRRALANEQTLIAAEIERLRGLISAAHTEVRKFERLIELDAARAKAKLEKRENDALDEFATLRHARRE